MEETIDSGLLGAQRAEENLQLSISLDEAQLPRRAQELLGFHGDPAAHDNLVDFRNPAFLRAAAAPL